MTDDALETRSRFEESVEAERTIAVRLADEVIGFNGVWTPLMTSLALQLKEQRRVSNVLRRQLVVEVAG